MSVTESSAKAVADTAFTASLAETDPEIADVIRRELGRQRDEIELIASENIVSRAVLEAQGSVLTNKYAEGLPGRRYYGGCQYVDVAENAGDRAGQEAVRRGLRQRAAALRRAGQRCGVHGADAARATPSWGSISPPAGISPTARRSTCRASGSRRCPMACAATTTASTWTRCARLARRAPAEGDRRRRLGLSAHHRFPRRSARSPTASAPS